MFASPQRTWISLNSEMGFCVSQQFEQTTSEKKWKSITGGSNVKLATDFSHSKQIEK